MNSGRKSRSVHFCLKCSDLGHLGPDCEWIGPHIDFCRLKATSVDKSILPAQNPGRQSGRFHIRVRKQAAFFKFLHINTSPTLSAFAEAWGILQRRVVSPGTLPDFAFGGIQIVVLFIDLGIPRLPFVHLVCVC